MARNMLLSGVALVAILAFGVVSGMEEWKEKLFNDENNFRDIHGSDPLQYNQELEERAQDWADTIAATMCTFAAHHAPQDHPGMTYRGGPLGENINKGMTTGGDIQEFAVSGAATSAGAWYKENKDYNYETGPQSGPMVYHFTQQVWKATREVGYGLATCNGNMWFLVARYFPAGNVDDGTNAMFKENVLPPQH